MDSIPDKDLQTVMLHCSGTHQRTPFHNFLQHGVMYQTDLEYYLGTVNCRDMLETRDAYILSPLDLFAVQYVYHVQRQADLRAGRIQQNESEALDFQLLGIWRINTCKENAKEQCRLLLSLLWSQCCDEDPLATILHKAVILLPWMPGYFFDFLVTNLAGQNDAQIRDSKGLLPLHLALTVGYGLKSATSRDAYYANFQKLRDVFPVALSTTDSEGRSPLHIALSGGIERRVMRLILNSNPEAFYETDPVSGQSLLALAYAHLDKDTLRALLVVDIPRMIVSYQPIE